MADKILTEKQKDFLIHLMGEESQGNPRKAMHLAGYAPNTDMMTLVKTLRKEILELAEEYLAAHATEAAYGMVGAMDSIDPSIKDKMQAMREVMDRAGVIKKDGITQIGDAVKGILFILPEKDKDDSDLIPDEYKI